MKAVLISIQPKWCELIASGKKTVEVRKTKPKIETPFKVYIYCTKNKERLIEVIHDGDDVYGFTHRGKPNFIKTSTQDWSIYGAFKGGKVIGEFVCDRIYNIPYILPYDSDEVSHPMFHGFNSMACLPDWEIDEYLGRKDGYGWHISDLVIYVKPRELSEFVLASVVHTNCFGKHTKRVTRPPQSWCYVESEDTE